MEIQGSSVGGKNIIGRTDVVSVEKRSEIMSKVRSKDTIPEILVRQELWRRGLRYRKNCNKIVGKPDVCFIKKKIAIFIDSEFWHGKRYLEEGFLPKSNVSFWKEKFERNAERDKVVTESLLKDGWKVLRFWEKDVRKDVQAIVDEIERAFEKR